MQICVYVCVNNTDTCVQICVLLTQTYKLSNIDYCLKFYRKFEVENTQN